MWIDSRWRITVFAYTRHKHTADWLAGTSERTELRESHCIWCIDLFPYADVIGIFNANISAMGRYPKCGVYCIAGGYCLGDISSVLIGRGYGALVRRIIVSRIFVSCGKSKVRYMAKRHYHIIYICSHSRTMVSIAAVIYGRLFSKCILFA